MKHVLFSGLLFGLVLVTAGCGDAAAGKYTLTIFRGDKVLATCTFSGEDADGDGMLDASELTAFSETEDYTQSETSSSTGFAKYADMKKMPMLEHGPEDIRTFHFNVDEFKKGKTVLEYETNTKRDFTFGKYHFWRSVSIKKDGKVGFFHGVGDGTQGLLLMMLDDSNLTYQVAAR